MLARGKIDVSSRASVASRGTSSASAMGSLDSLTLARDDTPKERLAALDVFRGATIAGMLLVNNPGSWNAIYAPLEHADWNGWTPTDLIFPFFLFIVGVTTHLSLSKRDPSTLTMKIIRRGLLIVLAGVLLNAFPFFWWGKMADI